MAKRSPRPGNGEAKKIEQLNKALDAMLARNDGRVSDAGAKNRATAAHRGRLAQSPE